MNPTNSAVGLAVRYSLQLLLRSAFVSTPAQYKYLYDLQIIYPFVSINCLCKSFLLCFTKYIFHNICSVYKKVGITFYIILFRMGLVGHSSYTNTYVDILIYKILYMPLDDSIYCTSYGIRHCV